jgi:SAM-dependent methyltransferase
MRQRRRLLERWYPEVRFGGFTDVDGTVAFYSRVNSLLEPSFTVLDLGCGRGQAAEDPIRWRRELQVFKGKCARVIGADVDPDAAVNPHLDEFRLIENDRIPLEDETIDLCISDAVVEHIADVDLFFGECRRVLKAGGYLCIRTPNATSYASVATRVVPNRLHARVLSRVQPDRKCEDVFATLYRCNTAKKLGTTLVRHGFECVVRSYEPEPAYLSFSRLAYAFGVLHQRHAPRRLRRVLLAYARKQPTTLPA